MTDDLEKIEDMIVQLWDMRRAARKLYLDNIHRPVPDGITSNYWKCMLGGLRSASDTDAPHSEPIPSGRDVRTHIRRAAEQLDS